MKKTTFITTAVSALILSVTTLTNADAQNKVTFGIKLSGELTNVKLTEMQGNGKFNPGASVGGFVRIGLGEHLSLQPELALHYTEAKLRFGNYKTKYKYAGVDIPVYFQGEIKAGNGKVVLGAGPVIGYGLSADSRLENLPDNEADENFNNVIELDHFYAGGAATAGYEFKNRMSLVAGYKMGFDFSSRHKSGSNIRTQTISLGVGYRF